MQILALAKSTIIQMIEDKLQCKVAYANTAKAKTPAYPFVSYSIPTYIAANNGTWGELPTREQGKQFTQTWSFTVQAETQNDASTMIAQLYELFDRNNPTLNSIHFFPVRCSSISSRDNYITVNYEYRYGFDVTFSFVAIADTTIIANSDLAPVEIKYGGER